MSGQVGVEDEQGVGAGCGGLKERSERAAGAAGRGLDNVRVDKAEGGRQGGGRITDDGRVGDARVSDGIEDAIDHGYPAYRM